MHLTEEERFVSNKLFFDIMLVSNWFFECYKDARADKKTLYQ